MSVQNRGCRVAQHYVCSQDPPGDQHVVYYDREGPVYHSRIDAETRWLESTDLTTGLSDYLVENAPDHASFTTLIDTGRDDFDFWTESGDGELLRNVGEDRLTGETVDIDGITLELTQYELRIFSREGQLLVESKGQQFVDRERRRFYGGIESWSDWTGESREDNDSPVTFSLPGESGFGATEPVFDCDLQMVRGVAPPALGGGHEG